MPQPPKTNGELLFFKPLLKSRVWGGQKFSTHLKRPLPKDAKIGESWEIVDRTDDQSVIANGSFAGKTLRSLLEQKGKDILGPNYRSDTPFPILVKWLDCSETLSLQVHPNPNNAHIKGEECKTENWYVVDREEDAKIYLGLTKGTTKSQFINALDSKQLSTVLHTVQSQKEDSYLIPSGTVHAIGAGHLILEIQQNSDTTYRVYDWDRNGLDGKPRELHRDKSLNSMQFNNLEYFPKRIQGSHSVLADTDQFRISAFKLSPENPPLHLEAGQSPRIIHMIEGCLENTLTHQRLVRGDNALLAFSSEAALRAVDSASFLITDHF